jgi:hypothetical protein
MKSSSIKRFGIVFLLVLVFFQQIGAGLYIHNAVHQQKGEGQMHDRHNDAAKEINFTCSCVDNFLTPFIDAEIWNVEPIPASHAIAADSFSENIYFTSLIFSSLRGPPVFKG